MPRRCRIAAMSLVAVLALTRCAAAPIPDRPPPLPTPAGGAIRPDAGVPALARQVYELVNRYRAQRGLPALALDPRIGEQARDHSVAMATGRMPLGHEGFQDRIGALARVMAVQRSAENVGVNQGYTDPARQVVEGWLGSSTHRANIEGPYESTGVGVARTAAGEVYFTQIFIGR